MKNHLLLLTSTALLALFMASCSTGGLTPTPQLAGSFSGQFRLLHRHTDAVPFDTLTANITLTLNSPASTFAVTGDTSTVIAGSMGTYQLATNGNFILFVDNTLPKTGISSKVHLNGEYIYSYDGTNLQMLAYSLDTLSVQYNLKKN
jgi:hypothetical protein